MGANEAVIFVRGIFVRSIFERSIFVRSNFVRSININFLNIIPTIFSWMIRGPKGYAYWTFVVGICILSWGIDNSLQSL